LILTFPFEKWRGRVYVYKTSVDRDMFLMIHTEYKVIGLRAL